MLEILINLLSFANFWQKIEIAELCKGVHCVDLGESFQTHIDLQNLASMQPRTGPLKFAASLEVCRSLVDRWRRRPRGGAGRGHQRGGHLGGEWKMN